jgi:hypothetical protein
MKDKEYLEFITGHEKVPNHLLKMSQKDILLSFHSTSIMTKFIALQILGGLISLIFCPQFGFSFFVDGHGITHELKMIGDWACALFCGSLFLSTGTLLALFSMKGEELWWIWNRKKNYLLILPALCWSALMLLNVTLNLPQEALSYHLTWIVAAIVFPACWLKLREKSFVKTL